MFASCRCFVCNILCRPQLTTELINAVRTPRFLDGEWRDRIATSKKCWFLCYSISLHMRRKQIVALTCKRKACIKHTCVRLTTETDRVRWSIWPDHQVIELIELFRVWASDNQYYSCWANPIERPKLKHFIAKRLQCRLQMMLFLFQLVNFVVCHSPLSVFQGAMLSVQTFNYP